MEYGALVLALLVAVVVLAVFTWREHRSAREAREQRDTAHEALRDVREQRDALMPNAKYIPMGKVEFARLAKTGCKECRGAGTRVRRDADTGESVDAVCPCVIKRMKGDPKYGVTPDGTPVRIATREEQERAALAAARPAGGIQ